MNKGAHREIILVKENFIYIFFFLWAVPNGFYLLFFTFFFIFVFDYSQFLFFSFLPFLFFFIFFLLCLRQPAEAKKTLS